MGKNYYISDLHFDHSNIILFDKRPFNSVTEMNNAIVALWNETVTSDDTVYILGDFCWGPNSRWEYFLKQLKGHKVLIIGNHDYKHIGNTKKYFDEVTNYIEIDDGDYHVIMSHYPILAYNRSYAANVWMLYGHVHNNTDESHVISKFIKELRYTYDGKIHLNRGQLINVGCMMPWINYIPRTMDELVTEFIDKNTY